MEQAFLKYSMCNLCIIKELNSPMYFDTRIFSYKIAQIIVIEINVRLSSKIAKHKPVSPVV